MRGLGYTSTFSHSTSLHDSLGQMIRTLAMYGFIYESHVTFRKHIGGMALGEPFFMTFLYSCTDMDCHISIY